MPLPDPSVYSAVHSLIIHLNNIIFKYISKYRQQDATLHNLFIYLCEMHYMFQAVPPPIIRSSKLCIYIIGYFVKPLLLPATVVAGSSKGMTKYPILYTQF